MIGRTQINLSILKIVSNYNNTHVSINSIGGIKPEVYDGSGASYIYNDLEMRIHIVMYVILSFSEQVQ